MAQHYQRDRKKSCVVPQGDSSVAHPVSIIPGPR
jgi:hypothetical protein